MYVCQDEVINRKVIYCPINVTSASTGNITGSQPEDGWEHGGRL